MNNSDIVVAHVSIGGRVRIAQNSVHFYIFYSFFFFNLLMIMIMENILYAKLSS